MPTADVAAQEAAPAADVDRSPVDLLLTRDEQHLLTANQTSDSISLLRIADGKIVDEVPCGKHPTSLALTLDGSQVLVTATYSGELVLFEIEGERLVRRKSIPIGFAPWGVAVAPDGRTAYVAQSEGAAVAVVDLEAARVAERIEVGRWPRDLALSPDGSRLAVGVSGELGVAVVDPRERKLLYRETFGGLNLGQMQATRDGKYAYFPWIAYGSNPITADNIRRGWVLASRIARVRLDGPARREAIALDPRGEAVGDPRGLALSPDEEWLVASASGSHELLVYRVAGLPFQDYGGPGDTIDAALLKDRDRFFRIPLGGRPMAVRFARDGRQVYVANYLVNAVQIVDLAERRVARTIPLGGSGEPSLARRGAAIFYDARRSLDQWYSCHSCHFEGGTNAVTMDTRNDGSFGTFKTVLGLEYLAETAPWTWHGWQTDLEAAMRKSLTETMLGREPSPDDVQALSAFCASLEMPTNPHRAADGALTTAAARGQKIFESQRAGCTNCHGGPHFTDGEIHDVGTGSKADRYQGYNTPPLAGVHRRVRLLHDGRAASLEEVLTGPHAPDQVTGLGSLSRDELADLIEYLKSL